MILKTDPDLPEFFHELDRARAERHTEKLKGIGETIARKRDAAVKARQESGIEAVWQKCEEAYLSMDDVNRAEFKGARWAKPTSMQGPVTADNSPARDPMRSTAFVRLTARYVDMGAAKVCEILLPIDDKAFSLKPTPIPELAAKEQDLTPVALPNGQPVMMQPEMPQPPGAMLGMPTPAGPPQQATVADLAKQAMAAAAEKAEKAETRIYDWMVEANYPGEMRKVINDAARIGTGVLKAPYPELRTSYALSKEGGTAKLVMKERAAPGMRWIDPWNFYPAQGCGENVHNGDGVFEVDYLAERQLRDLCKVVDTEGQPIYLKDQIELVLEQGPLKTNTSEDGKNPNRQPSAQDDSYPVWYFTGTLSRDDMATLNAVGLDAVDQQTKVVNCVVTIVNDVVIRATINPMDSGRFPYHVMPWSRRAGSWTGVGVAEQIFMPQRTLNASTRGLLNNAGFSAGVQIIMDRTAVAPADGAWQVTPNKIWFATGEGATPDVTKAFNLVKFPNTTPELLDIINLAYKMAEEATNIPLVTQGQQGPTTPATFGAAELQNNNANTLLRSIAYAFDDHITEPLVHQLYEWLLLDPDVPDEEKGDFQINARGSITMVEKAIQEQTWMQLLQASINPAFGMAPEKVAEQILVSKRLDPRKVQYTDEEKQQQAAAQQQGQQPPPVVQAAQIREQGATQRLQMELQAEAQQPQGQAAPDTSLQVAEIRSSTELGKAQLNQQSDMAELQFKAAEAERQRQHEASMKNMEFQMRLMEFAERRNMNLDNVKKDLTETTLKLNAQRDLSAEARGDAPQPRLAAPQVATPPTEPAGRAQAGQAYER